MSAALDEVLRAARSSRFPLAIPGVEDAEAARTALTNQLSDYLIPRAQRSDSPLVVVVGGSTGAGKSTLVNSLLGEDVSAPGVLRPTTHWPVLIHHPDDADAFTSLRILPGLERVIRPETTPMPGKSQLRLVAHDAVPKGLAIIDSPDIDSVSDSNREIARQLLAAADLWLFVTTAARYADAVPWELLHESSERGATVAMVLDRIPPRANREVRHHLTELLERSGLGSAPLFTIPELALEDSRLPEAAVFPVRSWIFNIGGNEPARARIVERTLGGALATIGSRAEQLAGVVDEQGTAHERLGAAVESSFSRARAGMDSAMADGQVLRGDVLARWQDFVGTGQFFRGLEPTVARVRDRITAAVTGKRDSADPLEHAIEESVAVVIREHAVQAVAGAAQLWQASPEGRRLLETNPSMARVPADFDREVKVLIENWSRDVTGMVRDEGQSKRSKARILSFGVNGVGAVLMLAVFAGTGGVTGAEAGVAGGTALIAGKLLDTIFGEQVTRELAQHARGRLLETAAESLSFCRRGFDSALSEHRPGSGDGDALRKAAANLKEAM